MKTRALNGGGLAYSPACLLLGRYPEREHVGLPPPAIVAECDR